MLNIVDEFTRQAVVVHAARSITADDLVAHLEAATRVYGVPELVRMDNGTELTAHALKDWCRFTKVGTRYIDPGAPWQNAYVESFNGKLRDELLDLEQFTCLAEARVLLADWHENYNQRRPHSRPGKPGPRHVRHYLATHRWWWPWHSALRASRHGHHHRLNYP